VLTGLEGGDGDLGVTVPRRTDVDQLDVVAAEQLAPVGLGLLPAELHRGRLDGLSIAATQHAHLRVQRQVEEARRASPGL
jgi:hypothetical protein